MKLVKRSKFRRVSSTHPGASNTTASTFNNLPDDLLVKIVWYPESVSSQSEVSYPGASVSPRPTSTSERPYGDESRLSTPPAFADAAFSLLIASVCRRWRNLARNRVSTLLVRDCRVVSLRDLTAAVKCFPNLTHVHLSDNSVETLDDAFLALLAASCPKLKALHVGKEITQSSGSSHRKAEHPVTEAGLARLFRRCTQLQHLSLYCLHQNAKLPPSFSRLNNLHTLPLTGNSAREAPSFTNLSSLASLSVEKGDDFLDQLQISGLTSLLGLTSLSCCNEASVTPFSIAQLPCLKSLELKAGSPRFDLMFPLGQPCSSLENLFLGKSFEIQSLPDDIGVLLPCLRELTISDCEYLANLPDGFTSLTSLQRLAISRGKMTSLPESFGGLPALTFLSLGLPELTHLPDSFRLLTALKILILVDCESLSELPPSLGDLTALESLSIINSPHLILSEGIGDLTNLKSFHLNRVHSDLPSSLTRLSSLTSLQIFQNAMSELPEGMGKLSDLRVLFLQSDSGFDKLPESVTDLVSLEILKAGDVTRMPKTLSSLVRLRELELGKCPQLPEALMTVPTSLEALNLGSHQLLIPMLEIPALPRLRELSLTSVGLLRGLNTDIVLPSLEHLQLLLPRDAEDLPLPLAAVPNIRTLTIRNAGRMFMLPDEVGSLLQLRKLCIEKADNMESVPVIVTWLQRLTSIEIHAPGLCCLPEGIGALSRLRELNLSGCSVLDQLPDTFTQLSCLHYLNLRNTSISALPSNFAQLSRLKNLDLHGCKQLESLPDDFMQLKMLHCLNISGCDKLLDSRDSCAGLDKMYGLQVRTREYDDNAWD